MYKWIYFTHPHTYKKSKAGRLQRIKYPICAKLKYFKCWPSISGTLVLSYVCSLWQFQLKCHLMFICVSISSGWLAAGISLQPENNFYCTSCSIYAVVPITVSLVGEFCFMFAFRFRKSICKTVQTNILYRFILKSPQWYILLAVHPASSFCQLVAFLHPLMYISNWTTRGRRLQWKSSLLLTAWEVTT